jgi:homocysteine S-methyltransferase
VLGWSADRVAAANRDAVQLVEEFRRDDASEQAPVVVSGCVGPRGDGYAPESLMSPDEAEEYHTDQIGAFADTSVDLVTAITMTHTGEAIGVARAAAAHDLPSVISFTVETDGRLPSGEELGDAIRTVDEATGSAPAYYMVNCAHPTHVDSTLLAGDGWNHRVRGLRANASRMSHEELDRAETLDIGDIEAFGVLSADLHRQLPQLSVLGGCCGTDARHIDAVRRAVLT